MASLTTEKRGKRARYRVQFLDKQKKRRSVRLPYGLSRKDAESTEGRIESLNAKAIGGHALTFDLARRAYDLGDDCYDRLVSVGLLEPKKRKRS